MSRIITHNLAAMRADEPLREGGNLLIEDWFLPGRRWKGLISIPGDLRAESGAAYSFEIRERDRWDSSSHALEELDRSSKGYCAIHADDTDTQAVRVVVTEISRLLRPGKLRFPWL